MIHEPATPQTRRREQTRQRVLDTALEIVREGGLEALTMHELARRLDLTPGALYRYFDGRDALIVAMQLDILTSWTESFGATRAWCASRSAKGGSGLLLPLLAAARVFQVLSVEQPGRFALVSTLLGVQRHLLATEVAAAFVAPLLGLVGQVAADLRSAEDGALDAGDVEQRALVLLASLQGILQLRKLERLAPARLGPDVLVDGLVDALLRGWGASVDELHAARADLASLDDDLPNLLRGGTS